MHKTDFGFHNPLETVELCTTMLEVFNTLPEEGGVLDQDMLLLEDMLMYKAIRDSLRDDERGDDDNDSASEIIRDDIPVKFNESVTEKLFG